jgi:transcriptional regulator with XRE-family HTH domain
MLKVGAVAQRLGVSPSAVRTLESLGLAKAGRSQGKQRLFTNDDVQVLRRAIFLRRVDGLNAPAILNRLKQDGLLKPEPDGPIEVQTSIGPLFRKVRLQRGLLLSTVASAIGVSKGFLSNLERSRTDASAGIVRKLAEYFGLNILDLCTRQQETGPQLKPRDRKRVTGGPGIQLEPLASGKLAMEPHLLRVAGGEGRGESYCHEGEEFLFLLRGRLDITLGAETFRLRSGDSFYFSSPTQHNWRNPGKTETIILWINTAPTF